MKHKLLKNPAIVAAVILSIGGIIAAILPGIFRRESETHNSPPETPPVKVVESSNNTTSTLETLYIASNPNMSITEAKTFARLALILDTAIRNCEQGRTSITSTDFQESLKQSGTYILPAQLEPIVELLVKSESSGGFGLLHKVNKPHVWKLDCAAIRKWKATSHGKKFTNLLDQLNNRPSPPLPESTKYLQAKQMYDKIQYAEKLPAGAERSRIMTYAIQNSWDVLIEQYLQEYLKEEPNGADVENATLLLSKAQSSDLISSMKAIRPTLQHVWEQNK